MIVRNLVELAGTERDVRGDGWRSRRLLRRDDGVKFSLHLTEIEAGTELELEYANHFEANYCIAGNGEVIEVASGKTQRISQRRKRRLTAPGQAPGQAISAWLAV